MTQNTQENEEFTSEELAFAAHDKIDALLDLLIKKKIITEDEFVDSLKQVYKDIEAENQQE